jgi:hypothetical protein
MITKDEFTNRLKNLYNEILSKPIVNMYAIKNIYARILSDIKIPQLDKRQLKDKEFKKEYMTSINMQLQSLESLQSLQRLQSLESLETKLEFTSKSMFDFDFSQYPIEDTIIYIDPPYEDTH